MKNQALFSLKDKTKKIKCHLLQLLFGALRVNTGKFFGQLCQIQIFVISKISKTQVKDKSWSLM